MTSPRRRSGLLALSVTMLLVPASTAAAHGNDRNANHLPDRWEKRTHVHRAGGDADRDGLRNRIEFLGATNPRKADSDGDGIEDAYEDRDRDGVENLTEQQARMNPAKRDSDGDRIPDGAEDQDHDGLDDQGESEVRMHPRDPDSDGDDVLDGDEIAGKITAYDGEALTIALAAGGSLTAAVTDETEIACEGGDDGDLSDGTEDGSDDESQEGSDPVGGEDTGDDASASDATADDAGADDLDFEYVDDANDDDETIDLYSVGDDESGCFSAMAVGDTVYDGDVETGEAGAVLTFIDLVG